MSTASGAIERRASNRVSQIFAPPPAHQGNLIDCQINVVGSCGTRSSDVNSTSRANLEWRTAQYPRRSISESKPSVRDSASTIENPRGV